MVKSALVGGNGAGSASMRTPVVTVGGQQMTLEQAEATLLPMDMTARCRSITLWDGRKMRSGLGWMVIDGIGGAVMFIGTVDEFHARSHKMASPWPNFNRQSEQRVYLYAKPAA